ncbi:MAG TPA: GNAT family N-acetyltransferase [Coleofasciculaceae cyanobacterium]|jgi:ribosomal protein S18 acetylase RimI-like enzyme
MIKAHRITRENVERVQSIYNRFSEKAISHYRWSHEPISFDALRISIASGQLRGYWVEDTASPEPLGIMLYCLEDHRAIEINVIYSESEDRKTVLDRLMRRFIEDVRETEGWDVVSFAMLGEQDVFIRTLTWYGFKPVGQAILQYDMLDTISIQILKQQQLDPLPAGYRIDSWKPEYAGETAQNIYEAFKDATDAHWDPRFRSLLGARRVVAMITGDMMGRHIPACTTVVLKGDVPVGFCFLVQSGPVEGNIPLIGVHPSQKGKGLGNHLLKATLEHCIDEMLAARIAMISVNTTMDTDNIPALRMYRRMGFRDEYNYPHAYLPHETVRAMKVGQWC